MIKSNEELLAILQSGDLQKLEETLKNNILESDLPKNGVKELSFIKRYFKQSKDMRDDLRGIITEDKNYYICDGISIIQVEQKYDFEDAKSSIIPSTLFPNPKYYNTFEFDYKETLAKLKVLKVEYKKDKNKLFFFNNDLAVNPSFLYDILTLLGRNTKILIGDGVNPVYFETEEGKKALLLPCRVK